MLSDKGHVDKSGRLSTLPQEENGWLTRGPCYLTGFKIMLLRYKMHLMYQILGVTIYNLVPSHILEYPTETVLLGNQHPHNLKCLRDFVAVVKMLMLALWVVLPGDLNNN
jgi:hypothetical protein